MTYILNQAIIQVVILNLFQFDEVEFVRLNQYKT